MPDSDSRSAVPSFERLRKSAKQLLRDCRAGDAAALQRVQSRLPRLGSLDPADAAASVRLADVQHALALEAGFEHWAALRHYIESLEPLVAQVQRFVHAIVGGDAATMQRVLASHPAGPMIASATRGQYGGRRAVARRGRRARVAPATHSSARARPVTWSRRSACAMTTPA